MFNQVIIFQLVFSNLIQITIIKALVFTRQAPPFLRALQHSDLQSMSSSVLRTFEYFISDVLSKNSVLSGLLSRKAAPCRVFLTHAYSFIPEVLQFLVIQWFETGKCNWSAPLRKHYLIVPRLWMIAPICGSDDRRDRVFFRSMINNCSLEKWSKTTKRLWPWKVSNTAD